jgi:hypothetical protein
MGAVAPQAGAATPLAKYNGLCGAGYTVVDSAPVGTAGTVYLTYNPSTGQDRVVTVHARPGTAVSLLAAVTDAQDVDPEFDDGSCTTYAGPVYIGHPGHCVSRLSGQRAGARSARMSGVTRTGQPASSGSPKPSAGPAGRRDRTGNVLCHDQSADTRTGYDRSMRAMDSRAGRWPGGTSSTTRPPSPCPGRPAARARTPLQRHNRAPTNGRCRGSVRGVD